MSPKSMTPGVMQLIIRCIIEIAKALIHVGIETTTSKAIKKSSSFLSQQASTKYPSLKKNALFQCARQIQRMLNKGSLISAAPSEALNNVGQEAFQLAFTLLYRANPAVLKNMSPVYSSIGRITDALLQLGALSTLRDSMFQITRFLSEENGINWVVLKTDSLFVLAALIHNNICSKLLASTTSNSTATATSQKYFGAGSLECAMVVLTQATRTTLITDMTNIATCIFQIVDAFDVATSLLDALNQTCRTIFTSSSVNIISIKTEAVIACSKKIKECNIDGTTFDTMQLSMGILKNFTSRKKIQGQEYLHKPWLLSACKREEATRKIIRSVEKRRLNLIHDEIQTITGKQLLRTEKYQVNKPFSIYWGICNTSSKPLWDPATIVEHTDHGVRVLWDECQDDQKKKHDEEHFYFIEMKLIPTNMRTI